MQWTQNVDHSKKFWLLTGREISGGFSMFKSWWVRSRIMGEEKDKNCGRESPEEMEIYCVVMSGGSIIKIFRFKSSLCYLLVAYLGKVI